MTIIALLMVAAPVILLLYASVVYPIILWLLARGAQREQRDDSYDWPFITVTVPAYNEAESIGSTLDRLLEMDYPAERRQIIVISDASSDGTDEIVRRYASRGVELVRLPRRSGKTAAENAAAQHARGEIVVNIDASVKVLPGALRPLIRAFSDSSVGVASGRDVSVGEEEIEGNKGEAGYVGYEMWVRGLETSLHSIIGASGCFFATRRSLYAEDFPEELSRDFASALIARENGYRSVSVDDAVCIVPRTRSLEAEYRRKVRTMTRGLATLEYKRHLLSTERYGLFAWMLISHKLCRWLFYVTLPFALAGLIILGADHVLARIVLAAGLAGTVLGLIALRWPSGKKVPFILALPGYAVASNLAGVMAWWKFLAGERHATWEPTRRPS
jgi:cellulose synthase/poly-beta-1,6-N-acetylglucosamine synthase-like glycosyltransferase